MYQRCTCDAACHPLKTHPMWTILDPELAQQQHQLCTDRDTSCVLCHPVMSINHR
jgi:hypothetical protein